MGVVKRGEVYWVNLDPTIGSEIRKTRPALVVSPDDMNNVLPRLIVAPITSKGQPLGCRPPEVQDFSRVGHGLHGECEALQLLDQHLEGGRDARLLDR